jgi:hypothetical protein
MARRRKSSGIGGLFSNKYLMYGVYAIAGYYGYQWWINQQTQIPATTTTVSVPPGTQI